MKIRSVVVLAAAGMALSFASQAQNFAAKVVSYNPGTDFSGGFTNTGTVLGAPSTTNPFGEATDPFNPPYGTNQVLSIGEGGSVTIKFDKPVHNRRKPHMIDFLIFGNSGFVITNASDPNTFMWIGEPATDGTLFASNTGETRVSVSRDGDHFYTLKPALAPTVDSVLPTDGSGDPTIAAKPTLTATNFAGLTLAGMRKLYDGSAGGAGYNIAWAQTRNGHHIYLSSIRYVRVEVISGKSEIDAFCATARRK